MNDNSTKEQDMKKHGRLKMVTMTAVIGISALGAGCAAAPEPARSAEPSASAAVGLTLDDARAWNPTGKAKLKVTSVLARTTGLWSPDVESDKVSAPTWVDPLVVEGEDVPALAHRTDEAPNSTTVRAVSPVAGEPGTYILVVPEGVLRAVLVPR